MPQAGRERDLRLSPIDSAWDRLGRSIRELCLLSGAGPAPTASDIEGRLALVSESVRDQNRVRPGGWDDASLGQLIEYVTAADAILATIKDL